MSVVNAADWPTPGVEWPPKAPNRDADWWNGDGWIGPGRRYAGENSDRVLENNIREGYFDFMGWENCLIWNTIDNSLPNEASQSKANDLENGRPKATQAVCSMVRGIPSQSNPALIRYSYPQNPNTCSTLEGKETNQNYFSLKYK